MSHRRTLERVIIADDLTGALDGAAAWGPLRRTSVCLNAPEQAGDTDQIVAVDTASRYRSEAIENRMVPALRFAIECGALPYKKIDSLFRGHTFDEIVAAYDGFQRYAGPGASPLVILAPAFPATGRVFVDDTVRVDGAPLDVERAYPVQALRARGIATRTLGLDVIARGADAIRAACDDARREGVGLVAMESATEADLDAIRQALEIIEAPVLPIGSAGLLRAMAAAAAAPVAPASDDCAAASALFVVGSYAAIARRQVEALAQAGVAHVRFDAPFDEASVERTVARLMSALAEGDAVVQPDPAARVDTHRAADVAARMSGIVARCLAAGHRGAVLLTGGETARAVLDRAGIERLRVDGEIEPGVVRSRADAWPGRPIVTKSGAFGDADTLVRLRSLQASACAG